MPTAKERPEVRTRFFRLLMSTHDSLLRQDLFCRTKTYVSQGVQESVEILQ